MPRTGELMPDRYPGKLWEHLRAPRNQGFLRDADVMAQASDPVSGTTVLCLFKMERETVLEMWFLAHGSVAAVATSSVATELVRGKSLDQVLSIDEAALVEALGGLPPERTYCAELTVAALHAAVHEYRAGLTTDLSAAGTIITKIR